jgi:uncharacterized protein (TIGR02145 family)
VRKTQLLSKRLSDYFIFYEKDTVQISKIKNMLKSAALLVLIMIIPLGYIFGQISINMNGSDPENSTMLDVNSPDKGILMPRVALIASNLPSPVTSPEMGLVVFNTACSGVLQNAVCPGFYIWNGIKWTRFCDGITCGFPSLPDNCNAVGSVIDIDSNIYATVIIGYREWMAQNLKVRHYNNGAPIPLVTSSSSWSASSSGARCWYNNDSAAYSGQYGAFYNFYAVVDNLNLCPKGWHVPTDQEWSSMALLLNGASVTGGDLKATGTSEWQAPNTGAVNAVCYSALPAGLRDSTGSYGFFGSGAKFWSSTPGNSYMGYYRNLSYDNANLTRDSIAKNSGLSVRCIKDCPAWPTFAAAGPDQVNLADTTAVLQGNTAVSGRGRWNVVNGSEGSFADSLDPATIFTGRPDHAYTLRWTIATSCESSWDDVFISFECQLMANAGPDQLNLTAISTTLQGNSPAPGTGHWHITSGTGGTIADSLNPASIFTGIEGHSYTLEWKITTFCTSSQDEVVISFACPTANAGPDQLNLTGTSTTLQGNTPWVGSGVWSIDGGFGGTIANPDDPQSSFTGIPGPVYNLRWSVISNCATVHDNVSISFVCTPQPTQANAGPDQTNIAGVTTTLQGNTPEYGTGTWSIASGTNGIIVQPNNPNSTFTGTNGTTYILIWSIINTCGTTTDNVNINFATFSCGNTFQDTRDGHVYTTITRGSQCWMKQNLNYNTGTSYCYDGNPTNCDNYGRLYDWTTASTACPSGWHLPTDPEWCTLLTGIDNSVNCGATGMTGTNAGGNMKETGYTYWQVPNTGATNSSGFSARGGGSTTIAGRYLNQWGSFWTTTTSGSNKWSWEMTYTDQRVWHTTYGTSNTMSVRCLKN